MPRYKITRVYLVKATTKTAALEAMSKPEASEYLEYESAKELTSDRSGWKNTFRRQVTGKV
jgi:hypothetical protein